VSNLIHWVGLTGAQPDITDQITEDDCTVAGHGDDHRTAGIKSAPGPGEGPALANPVRGRGGVGT